MSAGVVSPVVPPTITGPRPAEAARPRRAVPVPLLAALDDRSTICGTATIDCNGRVAEATVLAALGWVPGTRLNIRVRGGLILVTADPDAVFRLTQPGRLRLPATVRHWCHLTPGSRLLLVAEPDLARLVVHPPAALHTMLTQAHTTTLGGAGR